MRYSESVPSPKSRTFRRAVARTPASTRAWLANVVPPARAPIETRRVTGGSRSDRPSTCQGISMPRTSAIVGTMSVVRACRRSTRPPLWLGILDEERHRRDVCDVLAVTYRFEPPASKLAPWSGGSRSTSASVVDTRAARVVRRGDRGAGRCSRPAGDDAAAPGRRATASSVQSLNASSRIPSIADGVAVLATRR